MKVHKIINGKMQENCYVLDLGKNQAFVIDPGLGTKDILKTIDSLKLKVIAVLLTHGHFDHIYSAAKFKSLGAKIYITEKDAPKLLDNELNMGFMFDEEVEACLPDGFLVEGKNKIEETEFEVVFSPGHTSGSCVIIFDNFAFTGDTYFGDGIYGRCDFLDGNIQDMKESLKKLVPYLKGKKVLAGHD